MAELGRGQVVGSSGAARCAAVRVGSCVRDVPDAVTKAEFARSPMPGCRGAGECWQTTAPDTRGLSADSAGGRCRGRGVDANAPVAMVATELCRGCRAADAVAGGSTATGR